MSEFRQVTLKEVAAKAGVSLMTASRALRNQANVRNKTRQKVERAAAELNYRPNPLISALMSYRRSSKVIRDTVTIGMITNFPSRNGWRSARINQAFYEGAGEACKRHGYKLDEFWLREPDMTGRRLSSILYSRNISALLIPRCRWHWVICAGMGKILFDAAGIFTCLAKIASGRKPSVPLDPDGAAAAAQSGLRADWAGAEGEYR